MQIVHINNEVSVVRMSDNADGTRCFFSLSSNDPDTRRVTFASLAIMLYIEYCLDVLIHKVITEYDNDLRAVNST